MVWDSVKSDIFKQFITDDIANKLYNMFDLRDVLNDILMQAADDMIKHRPRRHRPS